ncbi:hypothetical protein XELAEV_18001679mg [Xenopus laevis]|uniref:Uncharacterized protein n=1 Tax=Xenopus laevis TaxID=8355 RepID=A0A974BNU0_XENLA|nr:hypothetical protein XELAEV_18001679mg [Xenopus laevis]
MCIPSQTSEHHSYSWSLPQGSRLSYLPPIVPQSTNSQTWFHWLCFSPKDYCSQSPRPPYWFHPVGFFIQPILGFF